MVEEYIKQYGRKGATSSKPGRASKNGTQASSKNGTKAVASKNGTAKMLAKPKKKAAGKKKAGVR